MGTCEIFQIDENPRKVLAYLLRAQARAMGTRTLCEDSVRKVMACITTPKEVISIT